MLKNEGFFWFNRENIEGERNDLINSYIYNNVVYTPNSDGIFVSKPQRNDFFGGKLNE